jgi:hypothetical protein
MKVLTAGWEAPPGVSAFTTLRTDGVSVGPYASLNLGGHVGDDPDAVRQNRLLVRQNRGWDTEPLWLNQVHGTVVVRAEDQAPGSVPTADGAVTARPGQPLVVMTADCLPVVACDRAGTVVGAFHAGWKGLLAGVLETGMEALGAAPAQILVWIGPAIGPESYQVGPEVRDAYLAADRAHEADFVPDGPGHWKFDLAGAAVRRLAAAGVTAVTRSSWDTCRDADLFFSHRRAHPCGRIGTFICLETRSLS